MNELHNNWPFDNSFARLPELLYVRQQPVQVRQPRLVQFNSQLAEELGLDLAAISTDAAAIFSGNIVPPGADPLAQAYAGHQFGHFTMLGDGRAILLGELIDRQGRRRDIQLKGSGKTPFSRGGDGRAALGPVLREYIVSEAMHALGIPTTRSLAVATTGEAVMRERMLPGAILTRVAASHIRVGTFEYLAARQDKNALKALADHVLERHYPAAQGAAQPYRALLEGVLTRQAELIARWMQVGFIHGVMNTDNMSIAGETIDYGPCAFMDHYDPATVFSAIDHNGRYAYGNQPSIAQWNLARFAETLLPLLHDDPAKAVAVAQDCLSAFAATYRQHWLAGMCRKLGLFSVANGDDDLIAAWLQLLHQHNADFCNSHHALIALVTTQPEAGDDPVAAGILFENQNTGPEGQQAWQSWHRRWQDRLARQTQQPSQAVELMQTSNPAFIPRNHRVEQALAAAMDTHDFAPLEKLLTILTRPFTVQPDARDYRRPPLPGERVLQTFCGT